MVRIRKKTSNRSTTHERRKLHNKLKEGKKKKAKAAKKDTQWKSKHKKDPGIPNNYPFKDQLLAELAEQRRIAAEEKAARKTGKKAAKQAAEPDAEAAELSDDGEFDGVASISAKKLNVAALRAKDAKPSAETEADEDEDDAPMLMDPALPTLRAVLDRADAVIEVLDARDPQTFRSAALEAYAADASKKFMFVMNKIDLCPREAVAAWYTHLGAARPTFLFRAASACLPPAPDAKGKGKAPANDAIGAGPILLQLQSWAAEKKGDAPLTVAVVGMTNVGKSALVNSLLKKAALPLYTLATSSRGPTTTEVPHEVALGERIAVIDTPGLSWVPLPHDDESANAVRARDILMRNKGRIDRLKDPEPAVDHFVARATTEDLMLLYNLPAFLKDDSTAFLTGVARAKQLIKKHGAVDLTTASRVVLRDWSTGRIKWYAPGPAVPEAGPSADEGVLSRLPTRKEMRRAGGLVKLTPGAVDARAVELDAPWVRGAERAAADSDDEDGEGDVDMEGAEEDDEEDELDEEDEEGDDDEDDSEEDEEEEEEEQSLPTRSSKRKRAAGDKALPAPPAKKVAFATKTTVTASAMKTQAAPVKSALKATKTTTTTTNVVSAAKAGKTAAKAPKAAKAADKPTKPTKTAAKSTKPKVADKPAKVANAGKKGAAAKPAGEGEYDFARFF